jgi:hypothetical protein
VPTACLTIQYPSHRKKLLSSVLAFSPALQQKLSERVLRQGISYLHNAWYEFKMRIPEGIISIGKLMQ